MRKYAYWNTDMNWFLSIFLGEEKHKKIHDKELNEKILLQLPISVINRLIFTAATVRNKLIELQLLYLNVC